MRLYFTILLLACVNNNFAQNKSDVDKKVNTIDSLFNLSVLKVKEYPGRTMVGSLKGYYYYDNLVLIKTLSDAEYGGIETIFYINNSDLIKTFKVGVSFKSPNEWVKYFKSHEQNEGCFKCHNKSNCHKSVIYLESKQIYCYIDDKQEKIKQADKDLEIVNTIETFNSLLKLLQDIK